MGWHKGLRQSRIRAILLACAFCCSFLTGMEAVANVPYAVPRSDAAVLHGVDFRNAQVILPGLTQQFQACDQEEAPGCKADPNYNTVILQFADGTVFFDGKMAIDADGSALSKRHDFPNQPETALRYPVSNVSLDAERVPYIVLPMGELRRTAGVGTGDLAVVVKDGNVQFAIVGDVGPRQHIGEGSMKLHMSFGRHICTAYDEDRNCSAFTDTSLDAPVLYFVFPNTKRLIYDGLSPDNINTRIASAGRDVWTAFLKQQQSKNKD